MMKIQIDKQVIEQALEAFELYYATEDIPYSKCEAAITALRSALESADPQCAECGLFTCECDDQALAESVEQEPVRQYYYKVNDCPAESPRDPNCICWHDEGTGPMSDGNYLVNMTWRTTAHAVPVVEQEPVAWRKLIEDNSGCKWWKYSDVKFNGKSVLADPKEPLYTHPAVPVVEQEPVAWCFRKAPVLKLQWDKPTGGELVLRHWEPLYTAPAVQKKTALERYNDLSGDEEQDPIERLRFFLSLALSGKDWLDVERFIDGLPAPAVPMAESITDAVMNLVDRLGSEARDVDPRAWEHLAVYVPDTNAALLIEHHETTIARMKDALEMARDAMSPDPEKYNIKEALAKIEEVLK